MQIEKESTIEVNFDSLWYLLNELSNLNLEFRTKKLILFYLLGNNEHLDLSSIPAGARLSKLTEFFNHFLDRLTSIEKPQGRSNEPKGQEIFNYEIDRLENFAHTTIRELVAHNIEIDKTSNSGFFPFEDPSDLLNELDITLTNIPGELIVFRQRVVSQILSSQRERGNVRAVSFLQSELEKLSTFVLRNPEMINSEATVPIYRRYPMA